MNNALASLEYGTPEARDRKLDERGPLTWQMWFIFGVYPGTTLVDISTPSGLDVVTKIPHERAEALVNLRTKFLEEAQAIIRGDSDGTRTV